MTQGKPTYVLGTGLSHDGSACLLKDGRICVAIEKERITRQKHDGENDTLAVQYCLDAAGIRLSDVALVVQNANFGMFEDGVDFWQGPRLFNEKTPMATISHHLAHAYSAVGTSPFAETAVLVIDGCGSPMSECVDLGSGVCAEDPPAALRHLYFEKDSYYVWRDHALTTVYKDFSEWQGPSGAARRLHAQTTRHSIGGAYLAVSCYMFAGFEDPGKLMGLAPYGRPGVFDFEVFDLRDGRVFVRHDWMPRFRRPAFNYQHLKSDFQAYADLARHVQREVERAVLYVASSRHERAPSANLAYAGGVALNAVANRRLLKESPFERVYIQPAAGDNGLAIGCAYYGWLEVLKRERVVHDGSTTFGRSYGKPDVDQAVGSFADLIEITPCTDTVQETAQLLADGKTVGWFQGGAEFGPRSLGHRSILADPRKPEMRDHINGKIKFREDFRPFAPSVPLEDAATYFDCDYESPYMILVAPVRSEWADKIPSVVHADGSSRIQTVRAEIDPKYHALLKAFGALTGVSVLLNTSFNRRRMPIVETPLEAVSFFLECELDVLVLGDVLIRKTRKVFPAFGAHRVFTEVLPTVLAENAPGSGAQAVVQIDLPGIESWTIDLRQSPPTVVRGPAPNPDAVINVAEEDLLALMQGPEAAGRLMGQGKLQFRGNPGVLPQLMPLLQRRPKV